MQPKVHICLVVIVLLSLTWLSEARHFRNRLSSSQLDRRIHYDDDDDYDDSLDSVHRSAAGRHPHPGSFRSVPQAKPRLIAAGAIALKKLVLLKFKKIIPISLIVLRSTDENEAELVPVYPTSDIPSNVQFIPTPNGISGHKDVQAIAIPNELHEQLQANGLADIEHIEALLNEAQSVPANADNTVAVVGAVNSVEDEPLSVNESDENQPLEGIVAGDSHIPQDMSEKTDKTVKTETTNLRRIVSDEVLRPGVKAAQQAAVEEIPLYLYSVKDSNAQNFYQSHHRPSTFRFATANTGAARRRVRS